MFTKLKVIEKPIEVVEYWFWEVGCVVLLLLSDYLIVLTFFKKTACAVSEIDF